MKLSEPAKRIKPSATLAINELIEKKRGNGIQICHMGFGESPFPVHALIQDALIKNSDKKSYLPVQGLLKLRENVSEFYKKIFNLNYSPDQILVAPGSKILIFSALMALDGPLFLPAPSWVSYQHQAQFLGKKVIHVKTHVEDSYRITPEELDNAMQQGSVEQKNQKILLLNYPCNPTGHSFNAKQLKELALLAKENNFIIISDEIYALISFQGQEHHSISEYYPEGTIVTGGLSKDRSLGGFRLGVMFVPEDEKSLLKALISIGSESWSSASAPIQYAAIEAYRTSSEIINYIKDCAMIHQIITRFVYGKFLENDIRCPYPQGAFYLFPDWNDYKNNLVRKGISTSIELSETLLKDWNVSSLPGFEFGMLESDLCIRTATVDYDGAIALKKFQDNREKAFKHPEEFVSFIAPRLVKGCEQIKKFNETIIS